MASKRPTRTKGKIKIKRKKSRRGSSRAKSQLIKIAASLTILLTLIFIALALTRHLLLTPNIQSNAPPVVTYRVPPEAYLSKPKYEVFPKVDVPPSIPIKPGKDEHVKTKRPKVAIILDDVGYDLKIAQDFLNLDGPLTFAVLPQAPFNDLIIASAHKKGFEIMLHLPMEPKEYPKVNPGPGALLTQMDPDQLIVQLNQNLTGIPYLKGVNNHMGSKMTASSSQMRQIFTILKKKELFFIDSRTTAETICKSSAKLLKIPFAERDIFIDHILDPKFIRKQLNLLLKSAQENGQAVGIAHPHRATFDALQSQIQKFKKEIQLVPASEVVHQL